MRILLADDHRVVRDGLKKIIEQSRDMQVVAEASDGHEAVARAANTRLDVVVLDISMPGPSGLDVLKQIKEKKPKLPVLVLSQHPEDQYALRAIRAGAAGYLTKESASSDLITAIRKVAAGGKYTSPLLADAIVDALDQDSDRPAHQTLSDREYEILRLLGAGKTVTQIAGELCLSVKTISTYRTRILEKMKMTKTAELILYVVSNQLSSSAD